MEYCIWPFTAAIWSALQWTLDEHYKCYLMYSVWSLFYDIWSTPCGHFFLRYGVLHIIAIHVNCEKNTKSSIRLVFSALWSTPYGLELLPCGVLHMALLCCHIVSFTINSMNNINVVWCTPYGIIKQSYGVLHIEIELDLFDES